MILYNDTMRNKGHASASCFRQSLATFTLKLNSDFFFWDLIFFLPIFPRLFTLQFKCERPDSNVNSLKWAACIAGDRRHTTQAVFTEGNMDHARLLLCRIATSVAFQWRKHWRKCGMTRQTAVALQNIGFVSDLGPHKKGSDLKKSNLCCSDKIQIWVTYGQKKIRFGPLLLGVWM